MFLPKLYPPISEERDFDFLYSSTIRRFKGSKQQEEKKERGVSFRVNSQLYFDSLTWDFSNKKKINK